MTLLEVLVSIGLMVTLAASMTTLLGAAVRSKQVIGLRTIDAETARTSLEWMSERLRNAGLNLRPAEQTEPRCQDMVVALDAALRPTANALHVSGEMLNSNTIAGDEVITLGYRVGDDPVTGVPVIMEYRQDCTPGAIATLRPLSDPQVRVTQLAFDYFAPNGQRITDLTTRSEIQRIRVVRITLQTESSQGTSGVLRRTWSRDVMLRNPEPNLNDWKNPSEP
ncbi:MAG: hypothetical protein QN122_02620 [Armatimonadota bacterium]|nr:hypothetical protein [Armatimonadota bacterium]MDR7450031.1 hypothetical protein [Armatimonadota bacterium]MDR7459051.1 hypothetical protein [Armatimonadota bacterium]MDR7480151.1 hypothetical protein [Armatimonadota bacterium]MDR7489741.1 hypothetical protein [Armatimonadota bacterium]